MEQVTQDPPKLRKIYDYLKNNNLVKSPTYEDWEQKMGDPRVAEKTYNYLRDNGKIKAKDFNEFQTNVGLKKKESTPSVQASPQDGSQISAPILESGLTEDQEKERNLAQFAQQPPLEGQPTPEQAQNLEFFGGLNAAQILQNQQQDPAIRRDQEKLNQAFSPEAGASQVVRDIAGATEKPSELQQIADNPGAAIIQGVGAFNKAVISTASSLPKSVGIIAKKLNDITGLEADKPVEEMATYKLGKWIDDAALELGAVATDPEKSDSFWQSTVPGAFGSVVGLMLTGGRGIAGSTAVGGSAMGVSEFEQAKAAGLSDNEAFDVYLKNYLVGTTEAIPLLRALPRLNKLSGGKLSEIVKAGAQGGLEEGTQEVVQQYLTNKIAQGSYDPNRDLFQDVLQGGAAGAFVGMFLPGIHAAMQKMTPQQKDKTQKVLNDEFKQAKNEQAAAPKVDTEVQSGAKPEVQPEVANETSVQPPIASEDNQVQPTSNTESLKEVDQKSGAIIPAGVKLEPVPQTSESTNALKETLVKAGKITEKDGKIEVKQNSGYPSQLFKDLQDITGDDTKALNEYLKIVDDNGDFKKEVGEWENGIMKEFGRSGNEYNIKVPTKSEGNHNDYMWVKPDKNGNPIIMFNPNKVRSREVEDNSFKTIKRNFHKDQIRDEVGTPEQKKKYNDLYESVVNKVRDIKLHLIHQALIGKMKGSQPTIEDKIRSLEEIKRLNTIKLAKDYLGQPMIFMHGGSDQIIKKGKFLKRGDLGYSAADDMTNQGIYFSRNPKGLRRYAGMGEQGPGKGKDVVYAFLKTNNPYYITDPHAQRDYKLGTSESISTRDVKALKEKGYDAVIWDKEGSAKHEAIVFDPDQIKVIGSHREGFKGDQAEPESPSEPKPTNPKTDAPKTTVQPASTKGKTSDAADARRDKDAGAAPVERAEQEQGDIQADEVAPKESTQTTVGETGVTKSESHGKEQTEGRQERLLTKEEPVAEAKSSASIPIGSDIYFDWQGMSKKGKIQEILPDGRVKIKGSDGTIYRKSLKEVSQREAEIKKAAPKDAEKTVEYNSKRKKPIGIVGDPSSGFMFQTDLGKTISKFFQKQFTAKGFLPRNVFDRWISAKGEISKYESQIKFTTGDLKSAIQEEYGKKLTDAEVTDINLALQGKQPQNPIPPKTKALVQEMRDQIDNLTMRFIDEGVVAGDMTDTFTKNLGSYITRSYQKYDDPFWADFVPEEVKNKAMGFLRGKYPNHSNEEMEGLLSFLMYNADAPLSVMKGGKLGSKDLSILKKRGDIAPEIRALMGEYGDPLLNYARSVTKMAGYIAKHHFLEDVKAEGMNKFLFEKPTGKFYVPIAAEGSKTMAPLNGLYTSEEIAEAFNEFNENDPVADWLRYYMTLNAYIKAGKTVFSIMTHARNFFGNLGFVVANGHWRVNKAGKAAQVAWANVYSNDKVIREKLQEYIQLGIVQDSAMGGQLKAYLDDIRKGGDFFQRVNESRLKKVKNGILDVTQNLYQFEDDLYKIYAFENEKARYAKAYPQMTEEDLNQKAAKIVRDTYPTYSLVPKIVKSLRLNPFVGTFVSFPAEVIRTTWNTAAIAKEEMSNPSTRSIGAQRMAGLMTALLLPTIASYYSRFALGMDGDDDEDLKKFVAPWQKTSEFMYLNREGTKYKIIDMGFSDPHSYLKRPIQALLNEQDLTKAGIKAAGEILDPFLSEEMLTARLIDVKRNEKETGDHVYNPDAPVGDRLKDIYDHLAAAGEPGTVRSMENIYKGFYGKTDKYGKKYDLQNEITALLTGQKQEIKDIDQALLFRAYEIKDRFDRAEKDYSRVSKSKSATPDEIADAERRFKAANSAIMKDAIDLYRSAIRLGVDPKDAKKTMYKTQNKDLKKTIRAETKKASN